MFIHVNESIVHFTLVYLYQSQLESTFLNLNLNGWLMWIWCEPCWLSQAERKSRVFHSFFLSSLLVADWFIIFHYEKWLGWKARQKQLRVFEGKHFLCELLMTYFSFPLFFLWLSIFLFAHYNLMTWWHSFYCKRPPSFNCTRVLLCMFVCVIDDY